VPSPTAKLFVNGGSQAVRLPAEFRFDHVSEVHIRRDAVTGDVVLSTQPASAGWESFFEARDAVEVPDDFLAERPLNVPLEARALVNEPASSAHDAKRTRARKGAASVPAQVG
jgi:antitoxin VapB